MYIQVTCLFKVTFILYRYIYIYMMSIISVTTHERLRVQLLGVHR